MSVTQSKRAVGRGKELCLAIVLALNLVAVSGVAHARTPLAFGHTTSSPTWLAAAKTLSAEQAITRAQSVVQGRVLSVDQVQEAGVKFFLIKILGANGRVSSVKVNAVTGGAAPAR
jgi:uncharacterized membrane protein YkoI